MTESIDIWTNYSVKTTQSFFLSFLNEKKLFGGLFEGLFGPRA